MSGFLPDYLLSCWEAQFPRLLYALLLKFSELDSSLSRSLANLSQTRTYWIKDPCHMPENGFQDL